MSKDELHNIAQFDAPQSVHVPNTWHGLVVWLVARFGVGMLVAAVFGYSTSVIYEDMRTDRQHLLDAFRENTRVVELFTSKMNELSKSIEQANQKGR